MNGDQSQDPRQSYQRQWRAQLEQMAAAKQAAWQQARSLTLGSNMPTSPFGFAPPGVNAPIPNPLLSRFGVAPLAEADPGNAMAGMFMGNSDISSNPLMLHALLGGEPGLSNV
jgi:hypothetical protein